jgi:hypothetical protein
LIPENIEILAEAEAGNTCSQETQKARKGAKINHNQKSIIRVNFNKKKNRFK